MPPYLGRNSVSGEKIKMPMLEFQEVAVADQAVENQLPDAITSMEVSEPDGEKYGFTKSGEERRAIIVTTAYPVPDDSEIETGKARNVIGKSRSVTLPLQSAGVGVQVSTTLFVPVPKAEKSTDTDPEDAAAE